MTTTTTASTLSKKLLAICAVALLALTALAICTGCSPQSNQSKTYATDDGYYFFEIGQDGLDSCLSVDLSNNEVTAKDVTFTYFAMDLDSSNQDQDSVEGTYTFSLVKNCPVMLGEDENANDLEWLSQQVDENYDGAYGCYFIVEDGEVTELGLTMQA